MPRTCTSSTLPLPLLNFPRGGYHAGPKISPKRPSSTASGAGSNKRGKSSTPSTPSGKGSPHTARKRSVSRSPGKGSSSSTVGGLHLMCLNIRTFTPNKWEKIQSWPCLRSLDAMVVTEHHLPGDFSPKEIAKSGWRLKLVAGPQMTGDKKHLYRGGVALLTRISSNLTVQQKVVADPSSGFVHQAATWTITSPSLAQPIHVTGVYVSPNGDRTEEFFNLLSQQHAFPPAEPHVFMGDFNAHTQSDTEDHLSPSDNIPARVGDEHAPAGPNTDLSGVLLSSAQRGRLLFRFLNNTEHVILNGRYQHRLDSSVPNTYQRTNSADTSIVDYISVSKLHFPLVKSCQIYNAQRTRSSRISDHNPILLHLDVLTTPVPIPKADPVPQALPPRLLFRCERLKDPIILAKFTASLEQLRPEAPRPTAGAKNQGSHRTHHTPKFCRPVQRHDHKIFPSISRQTSRTSPNPSQEPYNPCWRSPGPAFTP